jgi:hypothetical protein
MALKQKKWLAEWLPTTCRTGRDCSERWFAKKFGQLTALE